MQLWRPGRVVLELGLSDSCVSRRILSTACKLREASDAIRLGSSPFSSRILIKILWLALAQRATWVVTEGGGSEEVKCERKIHHISSL